jgi:hypothetical protein
MSAYNPPSENLPIFNGSVFDDTAATDHTHTHLDGGDYPQQWVNSNGNQVLQSDIDGDAATATIQLPYAVYDSSPVLGSLALCLTLEIKYSITFATNQFDWISSPYSYSEKVYDGYWLGTVFIQPQSQFPAHTPQGSVLTPFTNIGTMFSPVAISNSSGDCARTIQPVTIDYNSQADFNVLEVIFGACDVALTGTNNVGMTSFNRSCRIVDSYAINPILVSGAAREASAFITIPNSNGANPIGAYFSPTF